MELISKNGQGIFVKTDTLYFTTGEHFYQYDLNEVISISREEYLIQKYGEKNEDWKYAQYESVQLKNGNFITTFYQETKVRLHNPYGRILKELDNINAPFGMGIYGMDVDKNGKLWIAVPTEHFVGQFDINTEEELFSINGNEMEPTIFDHPEYVTSIGNAIYVSDMGNQRIVKINVDSYELTEYKKVQEPIFYYNQFKGKDIYLLNSGLYID